MTTRQLKGKCIALTRFVPSLLVRINRLLQSGQKLYDNVAISAYIGDPQNNCFGSITWGNGSAVFNITPIDQKIYYCGPLSSYNYCNRSSAPDEVTESFDLSVIIKLCTDSPSALALTSSYADPSMPQYTFISMINCQPDPQGRFLYYYGNDLTTGSISAFLKEKTSSIFGARSFIIESSTGYIIASKYNNM